MFTYINLINLVIYIETFAAAQLFAYTFPKRNNYPLRVAAGFVLGAVIAYFVPFVRVGNFWFGWAYSVVMFSSLLVLALGSVAVCVKDDFTGYLFCAVEGYALHHLTATIDGMLSPVLFGDNAGFMNPMYCVYHLVLVLVIYVVYISYYAKNFKTTRIVSNQRAIHLATLVVLLNIAVSSLATLSDAVDALPISIKDIYNFVTCCLVLFLLHSVLKQENLEREVEIINELYKENIRQYEISKATMASLHDLKHCINSVMDGKIDLSEREKQDINDKIFIFDSMTKTGNDTLDIILTQKMMQCHQYGIEFDCIADAKSLSFMDTYDIFSLFGNALSNAIEAVCREKEGETRLISLVVKTSGAYLSIHLENTFSGKIIMTDGLPETIKDDRFSHGFGVKSMYSIADKYDGALSITVEGELFILDMLFPIKQV